MSVAANLTLTNVSALSNRFGFIDFAKEEAVAKQYIAALGIKTPNSRQIARNLSGARRPSGRKRRGFRRAANQS